jgi:hypothetical protein
MINFPEEVWFQISLNFKSYFLLRVSKKFAFLYNEYWYKSYLEFNYPYFQWNRHIALFDTTYEELNKKCSRQGKIRCIDVVSLIPKDLPIKGIKASGVSLGSQFYHLILDFMGNLYVCSENKIYKLDIDVVDVDKTYYVKQHTIHHVKVDLINMELVSNIVDVIPNNIVKIFNYGFGLYVLINTQTESMINVYFEDSFKTGRIFSNKIKNIDVYKGCMLNILFENGTLFECDRLLNTTHVYDFLAEDLVSSVVKVDGLYFISRYQLYDKDSLNPLFPVPAIGTYINSTINKYFTYILSSEGVFSITKDKVCYKILPSSKTKSIFATDTFIYQII